MHTSTNIASVDPDVFDLAFARARCGVEQWQIGKWFYRAVRLNRIINQ